MSCSKVQRCERADHFQSTLPSYSHGVSFVHQQKNGLEFARKRYRFALASVEMRQSRIDGLLQAYYFQPFGRLRDPRAHTSRRVYMGQPDLHSGKDQNPLIFGTRRVVCGTPPRDLGAGGGIPQKQGTAGDQLAREGGFYLRRFPRGFSGHVSRHPQRPEVWTLFGRQQLQRFATFGPRTSGGRISGCRLSERSTQSRNMHRLFQTGAREQCP